MWDYDENKLKKIESGRVKILERLINFGVYLKNKEKLPITDIKKYWSVLKIDPDKKKFLKFIIWAK